MILLIDNYDSFVYNLARYVTELGFACEVVRNDSITLEQIADLAPSHIILSPGPCSPDEAGICLSLVERFKQTMPILGVCLGHQAIAQAFGAKVVRAEYPKHGKPSRIYHQKQSIFGELESPLTVARYHSLIVASENFPSDQLMITAQTARNEIMALQHRYYSVVGVQFHPESVLTDAGHAMLHAFLAMSFNNNSHHHRRSYLEDKLVSDCP